MSVRKDEEGRYILKVGDVEKAYTEEELFQLAQKGFGAEHKFESAAQMLKDAEAKVEQERNRLVNLLKAAQQDETAYSQVLDLMGYDAATKAQQLEAYRAARAAMDEPDDEEGQDMRVQNRGPAQVELPEELKTLANLARILRQRGLSEEEIAETLVSARERDKGDTRNRVYAELDADLDKHPVLGRIIKAGGAKAQRLIAEAREKLKGRIRDDGRYGPEQRAAVVKDLEGLVSELGAGADPTPFPGLGSAPSVSYLDTQTEKAPEPVSIRDGDYDLNIAKRLAHAIREG